MNDTASSRATGRESPSRPAAARLAGAAVLLVLACLAPSPQAWAQNAAPTAANSTVTTDEDTPYTFKATDFRFSDTDAGDTLASVKIVALPAAGSLTADGTPVIPDQSITRADIDGNKLVFTPGRNRFGFPLTGFTFKVSDGTAESASTYTMSITVNPVNDPPLGASDAVPMAEDTERALTAPLFVFIDMDGDALASVRIVTPPTRGSLTLDGMPVTPDQSISRADIDANKLVFAPAANEFGNGYASFMFRVSDGADESASTYIMTFHVTPVPDRPTAEDAVVRVLEDGRQALQASHFNFSDPDEGDMLAAVRIVTLPAAGLLTIDGQAVMANQVFPRAQIDVGLLIFAPAENAFGDDYARLTFKVISNDGESADDYTMTFNVAPLNDPPTAANSTVPMQEDTTYTFSADDFGFSDVDLDDALASVRIVTPPMAGSLTLDGTAVQANQSISRADIDAGKLVFAPAEDEFDQPYASLTFRVSDVTAESADTYTLTVVVNAVNDPPAGAGKTITTEEDTPYAFSADDFGFVDVDGTLASVRIVTLPARGSLTNDGTAVQADQSISFADLDAGKLVFAPAEDEFDQPYASLTFRVSDGIAESAEVYTMTFHVTAVNDPPTAANSTVTTEEDTPYTFSADDFGFQDVDTGDTLASVRITFGPSRGSLTNDGTEVMPDQPVSRADIDAGKLVFTPAPNEFAPSHAYFQFHVSDGIAESEGSAYTMTVAVTSVNDLPTSADHTLTVLEDAKLYFNFLDFAFNDMDSLDSLVSVRIVTLPTAGSLTFDNTPASPGQSVSVPEFEASRLVFTPAADASGPAYARFTFRVSDGMDESAEVYTMTIDVTAVNDPPTSANNTVTTDEDTPYTILAGDFRFADVDPDGTLASVKIVTLPTAGELTNDGTAVTPDQSITRADIDAGKLVFAPAANASGDPYASFTFKVSDGTAESADTYTLTVVVNAVNDPPVADGQELTIREDTPVTFSPGLFGFFDEDTGDTLASVRIVTLPTAGELTNDGMPVTPGQSISFADIEAGKLVFAPAANASGDPYASFTYRVSDGTDESADTYTVSFEVIPVNDPPTAADKTVAIGVDTPYAFSAGDFGFEDVDPDDALDRVRIVTPPTAGSLTEDGTAVTPDLPIDKADIDAGKLVFTPAANAMGNPYATFTFKVSDGAALSADEYTMTVIVTDENLVPTAADREVTAQEDTPYAFSADDFGFADTNVDDMLASVRIATPPARGALTHDGMPVTPGQSISRADIDASKLVFAPAANAFGEDYARFTFRVSDGTDESASAYTMTVEVTAANDPPTASDRTVATAVNTPRAFSAGDFGFADVDPDDALESVKIATLPMAGELTHDGTAVTPDQSISRADLDTDKLVFTPAADALGDAYARFTFRVSDGTAESASAYTMTVAVASVNDPPSAADNTVTTQEDTPYAFQAGDFGFSDIEAGDSLASVRIVTLPARGALANGGAAVTAGQSISRADIDAGRLVFAAAANEFGDAYARFGFRVSDGTAESASAYTMTVAVASVNDPPSAADNTVTTQEDTPYAFQAGDFGFSDIEAGDSLASVRIVTLPARGALANGGAAVTAGQSISRADIDAGRLVFAAAANEFGDPYTSFTFRVSDGSDESAAAYTMTVDVTPAAGNAMLEAWNARFGSTVGDQAVDAVTARLELGGGSRATLGGQRVGGPGTGLPGASRAGRPGWPDDAGDAAGRRVSRGMSGEELLRGSAFHLSEGEAGQGGAYALWGSMAFDAFEARADGMRMESDVTTAFLGADGAWGRVLAGVAVGFSRAEGDYRPVASGSGGGEAGAIESDLTGLYPYARVALSERLSAWGLAGYGAGDLTLTPEGRAAIETRIAMRMGAVGIKGLLLDGERTDGARVSVRSDAMWVRTETDAARDLDAARGDANRLRLILDAARDFDVGDGATLTPSGELGLRLDGGDAENGAGMELGGGMRYAVGGFAVESRARVLVAHEESGREEWGVSGSAALSADALGRGFSFSLQPGWGRAESGTETLWSPAGAARGVEAKGRLDARLGYGFAMLADRLTATPELGLELAESHRQYSLGWRLERARPARVDFGLRFEAARRETAGGGRPPEHAVGARLTAGW